MILLTGAAGFIGSCLLSKLNNEGFDDILLVDHFGNPEKKRNLENKKFRDLLDKSDFINKIRNGSYKERFEMILHIGACASTLNTDREYMMENNYQYSVDLLKYALEKKIPFYYASSGATYGNGEFGFSDDDSVTKKLKPMNVYGLSKHLFDLFIIENKLQDKTVGFKFFNVFGPNEYHKENMRSLICKKFDDVKNKGYLQLFKSYNNDYEDGHQKRDFVYIKDITDIIYYFLNNPSKTGIYNLGSGKASTWIDVAEAMFEYFNKRSNIEYVEMPSEIKNNYQYFTQADISKLRNAGYKKEFTDIKTAVKDYCAYLEKKAYI